MCPFHKQQQQREIDERRPSSSQRGYNARWNRERAVFLREHPYCIKCAAEGHTVKATDVDHIIPHRGNPDLMWNQDNWQPLCKRHHLAKTARERTG